MRQTYPSGAAVVAAIVVSAVALKFFPIPYFWIGLIWAVTGFAIAASTPHSFQLSIVVAGSFLVALALAEWIVVAPPQVSQKVVPPLDREDSLLGWRPNPLQVSRATATIGGELIYDVLYSIDQTGHRISPPDRGNEIEGCLFFFSDSFVFGEGVSDHETFSYQVGLKTRGRFRIVNLSFSGYGAEHMLATIERGELAADPPCEPTHFFYAALPHHVLRAAGKTDFSIRGPRYRLRSNGIPEYLGTSSDLPKSNWWQRRLAGQLSKSRVYRALIMRPPKTTEADIELYFAIVREAFRLLERRWPKAQLHLISWDIHDFYSKSQATFHAGLKAIGFKVHFVDHMLPGYINDPAKYSLHRFELHPNPLAHQVVASYLVEQVLAPTISMSH